MQFDGAVIREQGLTFAVVVVKEHILNSQSRANEAISGFRGAFPGMPLVLMGQNSAGRATYFGRRDIVNFLSNVSPSRIPWSRYNPQLTAGELPMAVYFHTVAPKGLLVKFNAEIQQQEPKGKIDTWKLSDDGEFYTHTAER